MLFAIVAEDCPDSLERRLGARPDHLARLERLQAEGRLVLAGPFPSVSAESPGPLGFTGSLIVAEFETLEAAESWAQKDPYVAAGVYAQVTIKPFKQVFPQ